VAIAAAWAVNNTAVTTTAGTVYTTAAGYKRDLVVTNSGTATIFIGMGASNVATSVASFGIPTGGTVVLTQCQVPASTPITACTGAGSSTVSIGYGSLVNYT
jgi:hypothetical protein